MIDAWNKSRIGRFIQLDDWDGQNFMLGLGWWDAAFEIYLGPLVIRFSRMPADWR